MGPECGLSVSGTLERRQGDRLTLSMDVLSAADIDARGQSLAHLSHTDKHSCPFRVVALSSVPVTCSRMPALSLIHRCMHASARMVCRVPPCRPLCTFFFFFGWSPRQPLCSFPRRADDSRHKMTPRHSSCPFPALPLPLPPPPHDHRHLSPCDLFLLFAPLRQGGGALTIACATTLSVPAKSDHGCEHIFTG